MERKEAGQNPNIFRWTVEPPAVDTPLSQLVAARLPLRDGEAEDLIDFGAVHVNGSRHRDPSRKMAAGDEIRVYMPLLGIRREYEIDPARVIYRDEDLFAYDKEAGVPSQPVPYDAYNNVHEALNRHLRREVGAARAYAGMHHRLDMETGGVLLFSLNRKANSGLARAFEHREVRKYYLAWLEGKPDRDEWISEENIDRVKGGYAAFKGKRGKEARTRFQVVEVANSGDGFLALAAPLTGRTHQIRLHAKAAGHPVRGDRLYGRKTGGKLMLHAWRLEITHPRKETELILISPVPEWWPRTSCPSIPDSWRNAARPAHQPSRRRVR